MADGGYLVVALGQADQLAMINLRNGKQGLANVGRYPYGVVADPRRDRAYVTNAAAERIDILDLARRKLGALAAGAALVRAEVTRSSRSL